MKVQQVITKSIFRLHVILPPTPECASVIGGGGGQGLRRETGMLMLRRGLKKWLWLFCFILLISSSYFFKCKTQAFEDTHKHIPHTHAHAHAYLPPALSLPLLSHTEKFLLS